MKVDPPFLQQVQDAGWIIHKVTEDVVFGMCPRAGCDAVISFVPGKSVAARCQPVEEMKEFVVTQSHECSAVVMRRRQQIGLTIHELEELAGMSVDFWAKFEKKNPSKIPNLQTFLEVCTAAGIDVVLRHGKFRTITIKAIVQTRASLAARLKMQVHQAARRALTSLQGFVSEE